MCNALHCFVCEFHLRFVRTDAVCRSRSSSPTYEGAVPWQQTRLKNVLGGTVEGDHESKSKLQYCAQLLRAHLDYMDEYIYYYMDACCADPHVPYYAKRITFLLHTYSFSEKIYHTTDLSNKIPRPTFIVLLPNKGVFAFNRMHFHESFHHDYLGKKPSDLSLLFIMRTGMRQGAFS